MQRLGNHKRESKGKKLRLRELEILAAALVKGNIELHRMKEIKIKC